MYTGKRKHFSTLSEAVSDEMSGSSDDIHMTEKNMHYTIVISERVRTLFDRILISNDRIDGVDTVIYYIPALDIVGNIARLYINDDTRTVDLIKVNKTKHANFQRQGYGEALLWKFMVQTREIVRVYRDEIIDWAPEALLFWTAMERKGLAEIVPGKRAKN